jgi:hypothetical protein
MLLFCELEYASKDYFLHLQLRGPREVYEALEKEYGWHWVYDGEERTQEYEPPHPAREPIMKAFRAVLPSSVSLQSVRVRVQLVDLEPGWRQELQEIAEGRGVHNQGVEIPNRTFVMWKNLRFRSEPERRIAIALDSVGALFLPNCLTRLTADSERITKESDFLVCHEGKWGILEVDGPYHPRAALDHDRDRWFHDHGIRVIQQFPVETCKNDAPGVVKKFLTLLQKIG